MMKRNIFLRMLLTFVLVILCSIGYGREVSADTVKKSGDFEYQYSKEYHGIELLKYTGEDAVVHIPSEIDEKPITAIGWSCFGRSPHPIKEVTMPDTVTYIGTAAFGRSIEKVTLSANLKTIDAEAFLECEDLKSIRIPDSVEQIGDGVFTYCSALEEITLSKNLKEIPEDAFIDCHKLKSIQLPSKIKTIGYGAFMRCSSLTEVAIPASVKIIKPIAFAECTALKEVTFSKNSRLKRIRIGAFEFCSQLKTITLPASLEILDRGVFWKSGLQKISFAPNAKLKEIPDYCFSDCMKLREVDIPKNVKYIGMEIFWRCKGSVKKVNIQSGKIESIGKNAFKGINAKAVISVPSKAKKQYTKMFQAQKWYQSTIKIKKWKEK